YAVHEGFQAGAVVRMHASEQLFRTNGLLRIEAKDLCGVVAASRCAGAVVPFECCHRSGCKGLLQPRFALFERSLVSTPFRKQRSNGQCTKRDRQDAGLSGKDAVRYRDPRITKMTDPKSGCPNNRECDHECCSGSENRPATGCEPQQKRE